MAGTDPRINSATQDLVAILDGDSYQQLFELANPMRVTVRETSKLTKWAVEDGTMRTDHRVVEPVEIDLSLLLTDEVRNLFERLRQAFVEGRELIIQTKVRSYPSMMITEMPHDEIPEQGDSVPVAIKLQEVKVVTPEYGTLPARRVANPDQSSTVKKGQQQTTESSQATSRKGSILYGAFN